MTDSPETLMLDGASCRVYRDAPSWEGLRTAAIGNFRCDNAATGEALLGQIAVSLRSEGYEALLGPMDGDTWHSYRVIVESDGSPPYAMEPVSGPCDLAAFQVAGFTAVSSYVSSRAALADAIGPGAAVTIPGVTVTPWDGRGPDLLIGKLFDLSAASFAGKSFFKPIAKAEFLKLYEPVLPAIDPRLVFFARGESGLVGFLFGLPNRLEGPHPKTAILKTYAGAIPGAGHMLADAFHRAARELGFVDVIHALMHVDNVSLERSRQHTGAIFRRYALMARRLP
jgi:hypothetical protein